MPKEVIAIVRLLAPGGQATPAPPVGPALGQHQVNIGEFVRRFNEATKEEMGVNITAVLTIYSDRSFDMLLKGAPVSVLLKQAANIAKGSSAPNKEKVGKVTKAQVCEIAEKKKRFLNAHTTENAMHIVEGTAKSMGIEIVP
jgi:large subunit ribosomal protein L11